MSGSPNLSHVADGISFGAIVGSIFHALPYWAALIAICWYILEFYESKTFQGFLRSRRRRWYRRQRHLRRIAKAPPVA